MIDLYFLIFSILKLVIVVFISGIIGHNRGVKNHVAGLRTHILVGIGACLSILIPLSSIHPPVDEPFRLAAQVISGIGFLGAGTIIQHGKIIKGLTTAASLWCVAIISIAIGYGDILLGIVAFILVLFSLIIINNISFISTDKSLEKTIILKYEYNKENQDIIHDILLKEGISSKYESILKQEKIKNKTICHSKVEVKYIQKNVDLDKLIITLMEEAFIQKVEYTLNIKA